MTASEIYEIAKKGAKDGVREALTELMAPAVNKTEAARLIGVSTKTVQRMVKDGRLKQRKDGRISREEIIRIQQGK